ncbi:MAG: carboxy terminal-processing peptidase, partial [Chlamydiae bacterium]|nr:carboxy terminal-processing peptidase [Chlamydiota bacterium]
AHIRLFFFYQDPKTSSALDIKNAIAAIKKEHQLLGVILDLRNNPGGLLPQAVNVTGLFIHKGIVASIKDFTGKVQHLRNFEEELSWEGPLIVLTNRASASAAEIVAQALQDYGRCILVGDDHTYGKGSYQSFTLESANMQKVNPQGEYKVTRGIYYTVSGKSPQLHGAIPDIIVPGVLSHLEIGESFAKYPLEGDNIKENFEDDLSDIHPLHRGKIKRLYKTSAQKVSDFYKPYLPILQQNSERRVTLNQNYQNLLKELQKTDPSYETMESFGQNDLQLEETFNIMKDLIFMTKKNKETLSSIDPSHRLLSMAS